VLAAVSNLLIADKHIDLKGELRMQRRGELSFSTSRIVGYIASSGLALVLLFLTGFAIWAALTTNQAAGVAKRANELSDYYQQARYAVGAEESLERKYRLEPGPEIRAKHRAASADLLAALQSIRQGGDASDQALVDGVLDAHDRYLDAIGRMFAAVDAGDTPRVNSIDEAEVDPVFDQIDTQVNTAADQHHAAALQQLTDLDQTESLVFTATPIVFVLGLGLLGLFWSVLRTYQRRLDVASKHAAQQELERLKSAAEKEAAQAASQAKSTFLSYMSHDLRTPLSAIIGYSEILQEKAECRGYTDIMPTLGKITATGHQLLDMITNLLDFSKLEAGKMSLYLEHFELPALIEEVAIVLQPLVEQSGNRLEVHNAADVGIMYADVTKVRQLLYNLLSNAVKFTRQGTITISSAQEVVAGSAWVSIRVVDTGIGIPAVQLQQIFEEFTQADATTTRNFGGTGLGLAICRGFCQLMGGDIMVVSQEGAGSTFTVRLPAVVTDATAEHAPTTEGSSSGISSSSEQLVSLTS
jgi:signal transduction histidine kinase